MTNDPKKTGTSSKKSASQDEKPDKRLPREQIRYQFTAAAEIEDKNNTSAVIKARTSDLSASGCFLDTINPLPVGMTLTLRLTKDRKTFESGALVTYSKTGEGMGVLFTDSNPEQREILNRWLSKLKGDLPTEADASEERERPPSVTQVQQDPLLALNRLIFVLIRKGMLSRAEADELFQDHYI